LTNAAQVRALPAEQAGRKVPIRLRGVLVEKGSSGGFNIVDDTAGLYAEGDSKWVSGLRRGDLLEVEGVSDPGRFGPFMRATHVRRLGRAQIPEPLKPDAETLLSGCMDAQWIEVSGVIRSVEPLENGVKYEVNLDNGSGKILVNAQNSRPIAVDSSVRLQGVCYYLFNNNRQLIRPYLVVPQSESIEVIESGTTNLNALPIRPVESLLQFDANQTYAHRVRIRGVVIHSLPGEGFWIHEAGGGTHVYCDDKEPLEVGTEVDVFGFLKRGQYGPAIEDAVFLKTGNIHAPTPIRLAHITNALGHDSDLVEFEAVILEQWSSQDGCRLKLSDASTEFPALLRGTNATSLARHWQPGARVRVAGICNVDLPTVPTRPGGWEPQSFQILLRSPDDITVLQPPPWWNAEHMAWLSGGMAAASLLVVAVVIGISRRRLRAEALERMKSEAEFAAVWNERNRMAREMHDTLAQGLSAISMQLEAVKRHLPSESKAREFLEIARTLVREKLADARDAIWNMRSQVLESGNLATALGDILKTLTDGTGTKGEMCVRGTIRRLSPLVENNLLRIGQEAITNASKYAAAKNILVTLDFEERRLRLNISDDGKGFDVNSPPASESGFGLKGLQERAAEIHAEFSITSEPGEGTIVTLTLPLPDSKPAVPTAK
jgi:signal transduction histidine kinase